MYFLVQINLIQTENYNNDLSENFDVNQPTTIKILLLQMFGDIIKNVGH